MEFRLPDVGEGITESVLLQWHVSVGQSVREDDQLCSIETDKAVVEIPAPCSGKVTALAVNEGETVAVGTVIASVEPADDAADAIPVQQVVPQNITPNTIVSPSAINDQGKRRNAAAPSVRRQARQLGIDLESIAGSGPRGRVLLKDLEKAASDARGYLDRSGAESPVGTTSDSQRLPMSGLRRAIAENMRRSVACIPHATSSYRCDAKAFLELRTRCQKAMGQRLSYTAMLMKAMAPALSAYPYFNASIDDDTNEIVLHRPCHIGFAVDTNDGLIVPVVRDVAGKTLAQVNEEMTSLAAAARERRVRPADLRGATITLSNLGSHGGHEVTGRPIINHPQVAVIAVGRIREEPTVYDGVVCARPSLNITASYDHRLIDGAYASRFMERFIEIIETPAMLLAHA